MGCALGPITKSALSIHAFGCILASCFAGQDVEDSLRKRMLESFAALLERALGLQPGERRASADLLGRLEGLRDVPLAGEAPHPVLRSCMHACAPLPSGRAECRGNEARPLAQPKPNA